MVRLQTASTGPAWPSSIWKIYFELNESRAVQGLKDVSQTGLGSSGNVPASQPHVLESAPTFVLY